MATGETAIERLLNKVDVLMETTAATQKEVAVAVSKIDDFSYRLKKIEEREEKRMERGERLELLITKMEAILASAEATMTTHETHLKELDKDITDLKEDVGKLKHKWATAVSIVSVIGGIVGYLINLAISFIMKII